MPDEEIIFKPVEVLATDIEDDDPYTHYSVVVLRPDQLDLIRQIVREELDARRNPARQGQGTTD